MNLDYAIIATHQLFLGLLLRISIKQLYPGANVSVVMSGREALQIYEQAGADLIILDKDISAIDAFELTRTLRRRDVAASIIIIDSDGMVAGAAKEAGASLFMKTPGIINELPQVLPQMFPLQTPLVEDDTWKL